MDAYEWMNRARTLYGERSLAMREKDIMSETIWINRESFAHLMDGGSMQCELDGTKCEIRLDKAIIERLTSVFETMKELGNRAQVSSIVAKDLTSDG